MADQAEEWGAPLDPSALFGGGGSEEQWGAPIDFGFPAPAPVQRGIASEAGYGALRGAHAFADPIVRGATIATREAAGALGLPGVQEWAERDLTRQAEVRQRTREMDAPSVESVLDVNSAGSAARWAAGKVGEAVPLAAGYMIGGVPAMVAQGALAGGMHATDVYGADPRTAATGAAIGGFAAGIPGAVLFGQAGRGAMAGAGRGAIALGAAGAGQVYAEPLAGVAAGQEYHPPDIRFAADAAAGGGLMGFGFGAVGGSRALRTPREEAPTISPEHQAAMQEALGLPPPQRLLSAPSDKAAPPDIISADAPPAQPVLSYTPGRATGTRFTVVPDEAVSEPARPSGGMNRGNLVEALEQLGQDPKELRRAKIQDLRDRYDQTQTKTATDSVSMKQLDRQSVDQPHPVEMAAAQAKEPSPAQSEAGNWQKGHVRLQGLDISIETPRGGTRRGPLDEKTGEPAWQSVMPAHYGYIRGTLGGDGQHVDTHMGPRTKAIFDGKPAEVAREPVFIVDQIDPKTGKFDEHKAMLGFHTALEAQRAYDDSFSDGSGPTRRGAVTEQTFGDFKDWLKGDTTKPVAYKKPTIGDQLKAKREAQKQRMAVPEGMAALVKRTEAPARKPEVKIEEEVETVASQVESQPQIYEHDTAGPTTVVRETTGSRERSAQTTNKDRILGDLESKIVNKLATAAEADKEYGTTTTGRGRDRKFPDLASYLKDRIEKAPAEEKRILEQVTKIEGNKGIPAERRQAQVRELAAKLEQHSPGRIEQLRAALKELESPEAVAANRAASQERKSAALNKIQSLRKKKIKNDDVAGMARERSPAEKLFKDERINRPVRELLEGTSAGMHEYMTRVASDPVIKFRLPHVAALARRLQTMLPNLDVLSSTVAARLHPERREVYLRDDLTGLYDPRHDIIVLNPGAANALETVMHEGMHAVTTFHLRRTDDKAKDSHRVLNAIAQELEAHALKIDKADEHDFQYALSNNEELHTMLMTSPTIQRIAASITPSAEFRAQMRELGYAPQESRSLWKTFTAWARKVVGLSASSDTLLDHVLRPIQDITDRAHRYNLDTYPAKDMPAGMRRAADTTADTAINALPKFDRATVDKLWQRADLGKRGDQARRLALMVSPTDPIVQHNKGLLPQITKWRDAIEARAKAATDFHDTHSEEVSAISKAMNQLPGPQRDALSQLVNDATLARAHLGPNAKNDHLTKPDQQKALQSLQAEYNALTPEAKKVYNDYRDYNRKTYAIERQAELEAAIKVGLPEATKPQLEALAQAAKTKRGIQQLVDSPDASPVAAAFADAWDSNRAMVREIAKVHSKGFVEGDFFHLRRYGDYVVTYGSKGTDDYGVEMFERKSEAETRRLELEREGVEPSQVLSKYDSKLREMVPTATIDALNDAIRRREGFSPEQADAVRDTFAAIQLQHMSRSEASRSRLRRQGVRGASKDMERVLQSDFLATGYRLGYLRHGADVVHAIGEMRRHARYLGDNGKPNEQIRAQSVISEIEKRMPAADQHSGELMGATKALTTFGFAKSLLSFSRLVTETIGAHVNAVSFIGARHGFGRATLALGKAMKEITPTMAPTGVRGTYKALGGKLKAANWNLSNMARDRFIAAGADSTEMKYLFGLADNAGIMNHTITREMQRIARGKTDVSKGWWDRYLDFSTYMGHTADITNKSAVLKAAFDLERAKTGSYKKAAQYALDDVLRNATPNYNLHGKSRLSSGQQLVFGKDVPLMPVVMQFKNYGLHMYAVMGNLLRQSMHGATKQEKNEARKAFAGLMATHALVAGVEGSILADVLRYSMGAYDWATGDEKPHNYMADVRAWASSVFGPEISEVLGKGLPVLAGVDLHRRIGTADMLGVPQLRDFKKTGAYLEAAATAMTGAAGGDALEMTQALGHITDGKLDKALIALSPRMIGDVVKGVQLHNKGLRDPQGGVIVSKDKLPVGAAVAQGLGFYPAKVSEARDARSRYIEQRDERSFERSKITKRFVNAEPGDRASVMADVREFNRAHPQNRITQSDLLKALQSEKKQSQTLGLRVPTKGMPEFRETTGFANVR